MYRLYLFLSIYRFVNLIWCVDLIRQWLYGNNDSQQTTLHHEPIDSCFKTTLTDVKYDMYYSIYSNYKFIYSSIICPTFCLSLYLPIPYLITPSPAWPLLNFIMRWRIRWTIFCANVAGRVWLFIHRVTVHIVTHIGNSVPGKCIPFERRECEHDTRVS